MMNHEVPNHDHNPDLVEEIPIIKVPLEEIITPDNLLNPEAPVRQPDPEPPETAPN